MTRLVSAKITSDPDQLYFYFKLPGANALKHLQASFTNFVKQVIV